MERRHIGGTDLPAGSRRSKDYGNQEIKTNITGEALPDVLDP
jgi:hypothetical protein